MTHCHSSLVSGFGEEFSTVAVLLYNATHSLAQVSPLVSVRDVWRHICLKVHSYALAAVSVVTVVRQDVVVQEDGLVVLRCSWALITDHLLLPRVGAGRDETAAQGSSARTGHRVLWLRVEEDVKAGGGVGRKLSAPEGLEPVGAAAAATAAEQAARADWPATRWYCPGPGAGRRLSCYLLSVGREADTCKTIRCH